MTKAYKYAIVYFIAFSLLLVTSGALLFESKIGFSITEIAEYYLGNEDKFIVAKTPAGVLKIVLPHLFAYGLLAMVLLHFLIFTKYRDSSHLKFLIYAVFISAFFEISSPFMVIYVSEYFAYLKLVSFVLFEGLIIYLAWLLFNSIVKN